MQLSTWIADNWISGVNIYSWVALIADIALYLAPVIVISFLSFIFQSSPKLSKKSVSITSITIGLVAFLIASIPFDYPMPIIDRVGTGVLISIDVGVGIIIGFLIAKTFRKKLIKS